MHIIYIYLYVCVFVFFMHIYIIYVICDKYEYNIINTYCIRQVLTEVSLRIPAGTTCAIVGRSGGGKSTIVHLLLRFYDPQEGRVVCTGNRHGMCMTV